MCAGALHAIQFDESDGRPDDGPTGTLNGAGDRLRPRDGAGEDEEKGDKRDTTMTGHFRKLRFVSFLSS
jgi:hypothetical protein